jgi:hypothetical protein
MEEDVALPFIWAIMSFPGPKMKEFKNILNGNVASSTEIINGIKVFQQKRNRPYIIITI